MRTPQGAEVTWGQAMVLSIADTCSCWQATAADPQLALRLLTVCPRPTITIKGLACFLLHTWCHDLNGIILLLNNAMDCFLYLSADTQCSLGKCKGREFRSIPVSLP